MRVACSWHSFWPTISNPPPPIQLLRLTLALYYWFRYIYRSILQCICVMPRQTSMYAAWLRMHSRPWIVSTLKGRQNRYSLSEVLTIQGVFNGIAWDRDRAMSSYYPGVLTNPGTWGREVGTQVHEVGTEQWVLTIQEYSLTQVLTIQEYSLTQVLTIQEYSLTQVLTIQEYSLTQVLTIQEYSLTQVLTIQEYSLTPGTY